jgi:hypothetical protein
MAKRKESDGEERGAGREAGEGRGFLPGFKPAGREEDPAIDF